MDRAGAPALLGRPGNRPIERPVDLEDPGSVAVALEPSPIATGEAVARDPKQLPGRHIEKHGARGRQIVRRLDPPAEQDLTSERTEIRSKGVGDRLRAP